ncbi:putative mitogen-activated protein kinase-binding protein 1 [Apostichopus japonicus]|uniref:Putative mitogen-activated protein kinase-binding protein 1 n=1 Tax=Stichopus japonicus TaxID=307972 RepID=A0A2G8LKX2_STIJA|nr:putative mitogen-activated protein kinase-binding protein 1 [Apostichopus japonicus]
MDPLSQTELAHSLNWSKVNQFNSAQFIASTKLFSTKEDGLASFIKSNAPLSLNSAFMPDGGYVVSVGEQHDMVVNVWDWRSGSGRVSSGKIASMVTDIAFSEDGNTFVTVGNRSVRFWYFAGKSKTRQTLPLHGRNSILGEQKNNLFCSVTFGIGVNSDRVYAVTKSGLLCEFNEDRMLDKWVELRTRQAYCITASEDHLFVGCADGVMRVFSAATLYFVTSLPKPHHIRIDVSAGTDKDHIFSPMENVRYPDTVATVLDNITMKLTCIYSDHSLYVWDVHDVHKIGRQWSFLYHSSCIWGVDIYPVVTDGNKATLPPNTFSTCGSDNTVRIWNIDPLVDTTIFKKNIYTNELLKILYMKEDEDEIDSSPGESKDGVRSVCFSPDGQMLASGDRSGNIRINDLLQANMYELHKIEAHDSEVLCLEFSQPQTGYNLLASSSRDRFIHIFDMNKNCLLLQTIDDHSASITSVKFSECGGRFQMISCGADKALLFRIATWNPHLQFSLLHHVGSKTTLYDMAVDVSKKYVATACQDRNLRIHNIASGKLKQTYKGSQSEDGTLIKVELDPSGMYAATSCSDKTLAIFDFYSGACMATMMGHSELVTGLKFTNDCRQLISVSGDGCIFVWKLPLEMTNNMKDRINERSVRLKVAAQMNQARRETFVIPPEPSPVSIREEAASTGKEDPELETQGGNVQSDYSFSIDALPLWAQKKMTGEDLPLAEKYSNPAQPKGKWAQKLGSEGFVMKSGNTDIPVRLQDGVDRRRYTLEPEAMSDDDEEEDDEFDFGPAEERLKMLEEEELEAKESPPEGLENVRRSRGSDAMALDRQTSIVSEDGEGGEEGDGDEEEGKDEDEDVQEVIIYPEGDPSPNECLDFQVTSSTLSVEELARKKHKRTNSKDMLTDKEGSKLTISDQSEEGLISAEPSDDEDDEYVDSTPDVTPLSSPTRKTKSFPSSPEDEEKFLHANFTFAEKQKFDQCLEQIKDIQQRDEEDVGSVAERRLSISSKFLQRSRNDPSLKSRTVDGSQILQELLKKRQEDTRRAVEAMRKRLQTCSITSIPEVKTPPTTPSGEARPPSLRLRAPFQQTHQRSAAVSNLTESVAAGKEEVKEEEETVTDETKKTEIISKPTEENKKPADEIDSGKEAKGPDRPTDLKLPNVIQKRAECDTQDQVCDEATNSKPQGEREDQKATELLLMKTKMKADEVSEGRSNRSPNKKSSKDDLCKEAKEQKLVKGSSAMKRSSSLSRLSLPGYMYSVQSYEVSTESAKAKIKKKVGPGLDPSIQKLRKKRNSQSTSGPLKATEDAIKPSTETKEREEDVGPEESKPVEIEMKAATTTTATTEVLENHRDETRTTNNLYEADTEHARRDNSANSLVAALEEGIKHMKDSFSQSLVTLSQRPRIPLVDSHLDGGFLGESEEDTDNDLPESQRGRWRGSPSTNEVMSFNLPPPQGNQRYQAGNGDTAAAQAAIDLLDQYSSMLVTLVQTKLDTENIPENDRDEKDVIEC